MWGARLVGPLLTVSESGGQGARRESGVGSFGALSIGGGGVKRVVCGLGVVVDCITAKGGQGGQEGKHAPWDSLHGAGCSDGQSRDLRGPSCCSAWWYV